MTNLYYTANVGAKLYIGTSTSPTLPVPGSDTFTEVPLTGTIKPPAYEQSTATFNVLNDSIKRSVGGKLNDLIVEGELVCDWSEAVHESMKSDVKVSGGQKRNWRIIYPNSAARQLDFVAFLSKWEEADFSAGDDAKEHRASFTLTVDGTVTETP